MVKRALVRTPMIVDDEWYTYLMFFRVFYADNKMSAKFHNSIIYFIYGALNDGLVLHADKAFYVKFNNLSMHVWILKLNQFHQSFLANAIRYYTSIGNLCCISKWSTSQKPEPEFLFKKNIYRTLWHCFYCPVIVRTIETTDVLKWMYDDCDYIPQNFGRNIPHLDLRRFFECANVFEAKFASFN